MAKNIAKKTYRSKVGRDVSTSLVPMMTSRAPRRDDSEIKPLTSAQGVYINAIQSSKLTFGIGPAGTGKTFIAAAIAADMLMAEEIECIIITRPAVEAGESLGFLPGDLDEKFAPYFAPVRSVLEKRLGKGAVEYFIKAGKIVILPLALMRGHSFQNAFVLLDEAQNTTPVQMKMFLSRMEEGCIVVVDGDPEQQDTPGQSGLLDAVHRVEKLNGVTVVEFNDDDIVRSGLVMDIIKAYRH